MEVASSVTENLSIYSSNNSVKAESEDHVRRQEGKARVHCEDLHGEYYLKTKKAMNVVAVTSPAP